VMSPKEDVLEETLKIARTVASFSAGAVELAKEAVQAGKLILQLLWDLPV
jgi:enoyl-CoA hydratase/carnithine racemase